MQIHVVQAGQTLYRLSRAYGVPIDDIASANELSPSQTLVIGQALVIPIVGRYYDVASGDTLASIAAEFGSTAGRLASVNDIGQGTQPRVGTRLYIPPMPKRQA